MVKHINGERRLNEILWNFIMDLVERISMICVCSKESDWWEAVGVATGEMGTIPRNYVILDSNDKEAQTYVHTVSLHYRVK